MIKSIPWMSAGRRKKDPSGIRVWQFGRDLHPIVILHLEWLESFDSIKPDGVTRPEGGGTLNLYLSLNGVTAFDATQSLMYTLLCSRGPSACGEAYLVTVDLQKGTDTEQVRLCGDADAVEELVVEEDEDEPRRWEWEGGVVVARSGRAVGT